MNFDDILEHAGEPAVLTLETLRQGIEMLSKTQSHQPLTYVIDATLERATGLPRGTVQPADLVGRRLALYMKGKW